MRIKIIASSKLQGNITNILELVGKEYESQGYDTQKRLIINDVNFGKIVLYPEEYEIVKEEIIKNEVNNE